MSILSSRKFPTGAVLNLAIVVLFLVVSYLAYSLVLRLTVAPSLDPVREGDPYGKAIQVDVVNGSGAPKVGGRFTQYLRNRGYDVVEVRTYHRSDVAQSIVVARTSNTKNAEKVATALGVDASRIIQEVSPGYYTDVSVVIGKDFHSLKPSQ
jgi:hypothetical protein